MISVQELLEKKKKEAMHENWLAEIHDTLMREYGWIPFEEFKRLPIPLVASLLEIIAQRREEEEKELKKISSRRFKR